MKKNLAVFMLFTVFLFSACLTTEGNSKLSKSVNQPSSATKVNDANNSAYFKTAVLSKYWELVGIQTDSVFLDIMPGHGGGGIIRFYESSRLESSSGLNTSEGSWKYFRKISGNLYRFKISGINPTTNTGENAQASKFDRTFFSALSRVEYLSIGNQVITLFDKDKKPLLKFFSN